MSSTLPRSGPSLARSAATTSAVMRAPGAMARANSTHTGWSGARLPCASTAVPPRRTASVRTSKAPRIMGAVRKLIIEPTHAGELRSRKIAASVERP